MVPAQSSTPEFMRQQLTPRPARRLHVRVCVCVCVCVRVRASVCACSRRWVGVWARTQQAATTQGLLTLHPRIPASRKQAASHPTPSRCSQPADPAVRHPPRPLT